LKGLNNKLNVLKIAENPFVKASGGGDNDYKLYAI
jgi:hypothetical protein